MASLEELPAPFPLHILKLLPDLKALDALTRASSVYRNVFAQYAVEIFECVMLKSVLDRIAFSIRAWIILVSQGQRANRDSLDREALYTRCRERLDTTTPSPVLFQALQQFTHLASRGDAILCSKLEHLQTLPHTHIPDGRLRYREGTAQAALGKGKPYSIRISQLSPSFLERQRVLRGAWRLEVYKLLHTTTPLLEVRLYGQVPNADDDEMLEVLSSITPSEASCRVHPPRDKSVSWNAVRPMPPPESEAKPSTIAWQETLEDAQRRIESRLVSCGSFLSSSYIQQDLPTKQADWRVLRSLGLGFWDRRRMALELELFSVPGKAWPYHTGHPDDSREQGSMRLDDMIFTWDALYQAEVASRASHGHSRAPVSRKT